MKYIINRTIQAVVTYIIVITISFGLIRLLPGGPMEALRAQLLQQNPEVSQQEINNFVQSYTNINPEEPIVVQYVDYVTAIAQGDLGDSITYQEPVLDILLQALPWTLFLMAITLFLNFIMGVALGALMAYREGSTFDVGSTTVATVLTSVPYYILAIILLYVLAFQHSIFPTGGYVGRGIEPGFNYTFVKSVLYHAALPLASLIFTGFWGTALTMRGNSIQILGNDYLRVARLRGLSEHRIAFRYVARNAILPMYTGLLIGIGALFGGSVILESIFTYPGVGYYLFDALTKRDYPLMMGGFLIITFAVVLGIYIADLTYGKLDPRASAGEQEQY